MKDDLGDRMKMYEGTESDRRLMPLLPVLARIDGRSFSSFTAGMERPYDVRLSDLMMATTCSLTKETGAIAGYTQSDEISLLYYSDNIKSQIFFDGRTQKLCSNLASLATGYFIMDWAKNFPLWPMPKIPSFDCRVWNVPTKEEATNTFLWRELDASKNSISMLARSLFSHKELQDKSCSEMQEMMFQQKGINWNDCPTFFKRGTFFLRRTISRPFSAEEIEKLPPLHEARKNPDLVVERSDVLQYDMPQFSKVTNRIRVLFLNEDPTLLES